MSSHSDTFKAEILNKFRDNLKKAQILDNSYPIQGSYILLPYGLELKSLIFDKFTKIFEKELGAQFVDIPLRIPPTFLKFHSNSNNIVNSPNFKEQHFLLTPDVKSVTSQPIFRGALDLALYHLCKRTIRSFRHLPQVWLTRGKVLRKDSGVILARDPEIEFLEGIAVFDPETMNYLDYMKKILSLMTEVFNFLGIPVKALWKPTSVERFEEYKTIKLFTNIPGDNSLISVGIIHYFHNYPLKTIDLKIQNQEQKNFYPVVINFGLTQRALFAYLIHNMDDLGFHFPPSSSLYDLSLVLRGKGIELEEIKAKMSNTMETLKKNFSIKDYSSVEDIKQRLILSEVQGLPFRLEVGLKDLAENKLKIFNRKTREKLLIPPNELKSALNKYARLTDDLYQNDYVIKEKYLENWEENNLVIVKNICKNCEVSFENEGKILGRDITESNIIGKKECYNCSEKTGVRCFIGNTW